MNQNLIISLTEESSHSCEELFDFFSRGWIFFCAGAREVDFDFREAGHYLSLWSFGGFGKGYFLEIKENQKVSIAWTSVSGDEKPFPPAVSTKLEISLQKKPYGCNVILTHSFFDTTEAFEDHLNGWRNILPTLAKPQDEHLALLKQK